MQSECRSRYRSDSREREISRQCHRDLAPRTDRHGPNGHSVLVARERPRREDGESLESGSWLSYKEDDSTRSECSSDGKNLPEDDPEGSHIEIEGCAHPPSIVSNPMLILKVDEKKCTY